MTWMMRYDVVGRMGLRRMGRAMISCNVTKYGIMAEHRRGQDRIGYDRIG